MKLYSQVKSLAAHARASGPTVFSAVTLASVLAACGGGGEEPQGKTMQAEAPRATAQHAGVVASFNTAAPLSPASPDWGSPAECKDAEFIAIRDGVPSTAPLRSRHAGCALLVSDPQAIQVPTMLKADGNGFELCKQSANRNCNYETAGFATFETKWQVYGNKTGGTKTFAAQTRIVKWEWNPSFTLGKPSLNIEVKPTVSCDLMGGTSGIGNPSCRLMTPASFNLALSSGSAGAKVSFDVMFGWGGSTADTQYASFRVRSNGVDYKTTQADLPVGQTDWPHANLAGTNGMSWEPEIRCDRMQRGSRSQFGCVMPEAAAVFVMDSAPGNPAYEAAIHIRDAQTLPQPGMSGLAPGVYTPMAGTRAVAATGLDSPRTPLFYSPKSSTMNRNAACNASDALIALRGWPGSASCPKGAPGCSCDEYPFATTTQGGAYAPWTTSVRMIKLADNTMGGSLWSAFLSRERVLPDDVATDPVYVYVK